MKTLRRYINAGETRYDVDFELGYLTNTHVFVYAGTDDTLYETQLSYIWVSSTEIELTEPTEYSIGTQINIRRVVPSDTLYVTFKNDVGISDESLNNGNLQPLMLLEEVDDGFAGSDSSQKQDLNMGGFNVTNMADGVEPQDAVTLSQLSAIEAGSDAVTGQVFRGFTDGVTDFFLLPFAINAENYNMAVYTDGILQYDAFPCDGTGTLVTTGTTLYVNVGSVFKAGVEVFVKSVTPDAYPVGISFTSGEGSPEGVQTAGKGSLYTDVLGGAGAVLYVKESGSSATGWVAK